MKESILQYVWQHKLFLQSNLQTADGEKVEIIDVGKSNTDAGPDFFNSKIKIDGTLWVGNVEIHLRSSEWIKHGHQKDKAYDTVILHVVAEMDGEVFRTDGTKIPQLVLPFSKDIEANYDSLLNNNKWIPCADKIEKISEIFIQSWKNALLVERLEQKMIEIENLLTQNHYHWGEAFYIIIARNFGFGTNGQAFELLAKSVPLTVLAKHKDNLMQLESILFGQAGLLPVDTSDDEYAMQLIKEYAFLRNKFSLQPIDCSQWKLFRLRPYNFPHVRIAQFASLIHQSSKLFSKIIETPNLELMKDLFSCKPSNYWQTHYLFGSASPKSTKQLGLYSIYSIVINTIVPFLFCYASKKNNEDLKDKSLHLLEAIPSEKNAIVKGWRNIGIASESAFDSQALIQLKKQYCDTKKCLFCRIGHKVLTLQTT